MVLVLVLVLAASLAASASASASAAASAASMVIEMEIMVAVRPDALELNIRPLHAERCRVHLHLRARDSDIAGEAVS